MLLWGCCVWVCLFFVLFFCFCVLDRGFKKQEIGVDKSTLAYYCVGSKGKEVRANGQ